MNIYRVYIKERNEPSRPPRPMRPLFTKFKYLVVANTTGEVCNGYPNAYKVKLVQENFTCLGKPEI